VAVPRVRDCLQKTPVNWIYRGFRIEIFFEFNICGTRRCIPFYSASRKRQVDSYFSQQLIHNRIPSSPILLVISGQNSILHCCSYSYKYQKVIISVLIPTSFNFWRLVDIKLVKIPKAVYFTKSDPLVSGQSGRQIGCRIW
jgi:hypothetical protein